MEGKTLKRSSEGAEMKSKPERRQSNRIKSKLSSSTGALSLTNYVHPPTSIMVLSAIRSLQRDNGSSYQAIIKYISNTYDTNIDKLKPYLKKYLKSAVASGLLCQLTGKGACGSFKLAIEAKKGNKSSRPKNIVETSVKNLDSPEKGLLRLDAQTKSSKKSASPNRSETQDSDESLITPLNQEANTRSLSDKLLGSLHSSPSYNINKINKLNSKFLSPPAKSTQKKKIISKQIRASIASSQPCRSKRSSLSSLPLSENSSTDNIHPSTSSESESKSSYITRHSSKPSLPDSVVSCNSVHSSKFTVENSQATRRSKRK